MQREVEGKGRASRFIVGADLSTDSAPSHMTESCPRPPTFAHVLNRLLLNSIRGITRPLPPLTPPAVGRVVQSPATASLQTHVGPKNILLARASTTHASPGKCSPPLKKTGNEQHVILSSSSGQKHSTVVTGTEDSRGAACSLTSSLTLKPVLPSTKHTFSSLQLVTQVARSGLHPHILPSTKHTTSSLPLVTQVPKVEVPLDPTFHQFPPPPV